MAMTAMNMVSAWGFSGVSFHLRTYPQRVASVLCKKNLDFWVQTIKVRPPDGMLINTLNVQGHSDMRPGYLPARLVHGGLGEFDE